jgi:hypothetical protein
MRMKSRTAVAIISLVIVTSLGAQNPAPSAGSRTRAITERDLFDFIWVANPQLSPDGTRVAFTRVNVDEKLRRAKFLSALPRPPAGPLLLRNEYLAAENQRTAS